MTNEKTSFSEPSHKFEGKGKIIGIISIKGGSENQWHASELRSVECESSLSLAQLPELAHNSRFSGHPFKLGGVLK